MLSCIISMGHVQSTICFVSVNCIVAICSCCLQLFVGFRSSELEAAFDFGSRCVSVVRDVNVSPKLLADVVTFVRLMFKNLSGGKINGKWKSEWLMSVSITALIVYQQFYEVLNWMEPCPEILPPFFQLSIRRLTALLTFGGDDQSTIRCNVWVDFGSRRVPDPLPEKRGERNGSKPSVLDKFWIPDCSSSQDQILFHSQKSFFPTAD